MIFELVNDFSDVLAVMPADHPRRRMLRLLEEAIRRDAHFIVRHPTTMFQCMWNTCWWYDCPEAADHYDLPTCGWLARADESSWPQSGDDKFCRLLERWRAARDLAVPRALWLRSVRPPAVPLNSPQRAVLRGHRFEVLSVAFSPDGQGLASADEGGSLRIWDVYSGRELKCLEPPLRDGKGAAQSIAFSPDGRRVAVGCRSGGLRIWDVDSGEQVILPHKLFGNAVTCVAFSPDGRLLAAGQQHGSVHDGSIQVWDARDFRKLGNARVDAQILCVTFSPDSRRIASAGYDGAFGIWDADSLGELAWPDDRRGCRGSVVAFSPDGQRIAVGDSNALRIRATGSGEELVCVTGQQASVQSVMFSPDGAYIASGAFDGTVRLWDADTCAELLCLRGHQRTGVYSISFSPDGRRVASGGDDGTVRIWDVSGGRQPAYLHGHQTTVAAVAFSLDGRRITSEGGDGSMLLWDAETGRCLGDITGQVGAANVRRIPRWLPVRGVISRSETVLVETYNSKPVASYPVALYRMQTSPSGRTWAGGDANSVSIIKLEGNLPSGGIPPAVRGFAVAALSGLLFAWLARQAASNNLLVSFVAASVASLATLAVALTAGGLLVRRTGCSPTTGCRLFVVWLILVATIGGFWHWSGSVTTLLGCILWAVLFGIIGAIVGGIVSNGQRESHGETTIVKLDR